jgi:hypothetical protein
LVEETINGYIDIPECLLRGNTSVAKQMDDRNVNDDFMLVTVEPMEYIDSASELLVDPVTFHDWELLQANALALEEGQLLQQITVVYSSQVIHLSMPNNNATANLIVSPRNFQKDDESSIWPKDGTTSTKNNCTGSSTPFGHRRRYPCYRLLADTQIIITPKSSPQTTMQPLQTTLLQLIATRQDYELFDWAMIPLAEQLPMNLVSVPQGSVMIHPNTLAQIRSTNNHVSIASQPNPLLALVCDRDAGDGDGNVAVVVHVSESTTVPEHHAGKCVTFYYCHFVFSRFFQVIIYQ